MGEVKTLGGLPEIGGGGLASKGHRKWVWRGGNDMRKSLGKRLNTEREKPVIILNHICIQILFVPGIFFETQF